MAAGVDASVEAGACVGAAVVVVAVVVVVAAGVAVVAGAAVLVDGEAVGNTPVVAKMSRNERHTITVKLEGYQPFEVKTSRHMNGWVIGNLVFGGPLGLIIDFADGAAYKLTPKEIAAQLGRSNANARVQNGTLYVFLTRDADSTWQKIGQLQPVR